MSRERKGRLVLTPLHPFTKREAEIIQHKANGLTTAEIAKKLGITYRSCLNHISGTLPYGSIYERVEWITGIRPNKSNLIPILLDDVLFYRDK